MTQPEKPNWRDYTLEDLPDRCSVKVKPQVEKGHYFWIARLFYAERLLQEYRHYNVWDSTLMTMERFDTRQDAIAYAVSHAEREARDYAEEHFNDTAEWENAE